MNLRAASVVTAVFSTLTAQATRAQDRPVDMPPPQSLHVLPATSEPEVDRLLKGMEEAYGSMDVDRWVSFFTDDVEQVDVPRRVHIVGKDAWRDQTVRINAAHTEMARIHHGRALVGRWIVVETEWTGTVVGEAVAAPGRNRSYRYSGLVLLEVDGGRVRRQIIYGDVTTLTEQLGVGQAKSPTDR